MVCGGNKTSIKAYAVKTYCRQPRNGVVVGRKLINALSVRRKAVRRVKRIKAKQQVAASTIQALFRGVAARRAAARARVVAIPAAAPEPRRSARVRGRRQ
jgi:hypothetical protein